MIQLRPHQQDALDALQQHSKGICVFPTGGGGGGSNAGGVGNPGSIGPAGSGGAASPSTSPGISLTPRTSYPVTVAPGGFVTISWNIQ